MNIQNQSVSQWSIPAVDVWERDGDFSLRVNLPGVRKENVDLRVERGVISLEARREDRSEVGYRRVLRLPEEVDVDQIGAEMQHGVLEISLPRASRFRGRTIDVRG
jgi:HSP20 family protein